MNEFAEESQDSVGHLNASGSNALGTDFMLHEIDRT